MIELRGVTWDHPRGIGGARAAAEAFAVERPDVRVTWEPRSLQAFADEPVEELARRYDLIVLDHPSVGEAAEREAVVALDAYLDDTFLADQDANSVGRSAESYVWGGHRWALALDAAAQVSAFREDLLGDHAIPETWDEVLALATAVRAEGRWVAMPSIPVDAICAFLAMCAALGEEPCREDRVVSREIGREAATTLAGVLTVAHPESRSLNPPRTFARMATTDEIVYVPLAFGYVNHATASDGSHALGFAGGPAGQDGRPRGTLGGAGIAVSASSAHRDEACAFAAFACSPGVAGGSVRRRRRPAGTPRRVARPACERDARGLLRAHPARARRRVPARAPRRLHRVPDRRRRGPARVARRRGRRPRGRARRDARRDRRAVPRVAPCRRGEPAMSATEPTMTPMALEGVRVLDFTQMMMGPWATQFLGDMGAEVIKIERPGAGEWERGLLAMGELLGGQSPFFLAMNRNKKSVTLDLKHAAARDLVLGLAETADLVTENFRPGVMDRLGIGYDALREVNPSIVYVAGTGYGSDGPYATRPGQDLLIQSLSGLAAYGGRRDDPPTPSGSSIVDASTALLLAFSAMVALFHKQRTGEGQKVEVDLFSTAIALQCQEIAAFLNMDRRWERSAAGIGAAWLSAPFGIYGTSDGHLAIAMASLAVLGELLGLPELAAYDDPERAYEDRDKVRERIQARLLEDTTEAWRELLATRDVWCAPVQGFEDLEHDPQVEHNDLLQTVKHPDGRDLRVVGVPMRFSGTPGAIRSGPPGVGEHTDEVLRDVLGLGDDEIARLREEGAI